MDPETLRLALLEQEYGTPTIRICYECKKFAVNLDSTYDDGKICFCCGRGFCLDCIRKGGFSKYDVPKGRKLSSAEMRSACKFGISPAVDHSIRDIVCKECVDAGKLKCGTCGKTALTWGEDWYREKDRPYRLACASCRAFKYRSRRFVQFNNWEELSSDEDDDWQEVTGYPEAVTPLYEREDLAPVA